MGFRYHKSINLGGGVRLNVSKKGLGISAGVKGARVSIGPNGKRTTLSIPGTGLSYTKYTSNKSNDKKDTVNVPNQFDTSTIRYFHRNRIVAGFLAIFFGCIGIQKFYLRQYKTGFYYFCFCWTCIPFFLGLIEGITILTHSKDEFNYKYNLN